MLVRKGIMDWIKDLENKVGKDKRRELPELSLLGTSGHAW